jgi:prenyl protein peptidase
MSLYIFVPPSVQKLPRDDPLHIQWRSAAIVVVVALCVAIYPWLFCEVDSDTDDPPFYVYLGIVTRLSLTEALLQDGKILCHVLVLYLGSFACSWMQIYHYARLIQQNESKSKQTVNSTRSTPKPIHLYTSFQQTYLQPTLNSFQSFFRTIRWIQLRNLLIAPIAEEVIFRSILLPPLLCSGFTPIKSSWVAPLFFGVAHFHHFYMKRNPCGRKQLVLGLILQWSYTTLFGAYASHVFIRTGSLWGICWIHSFCNYMGLPEVQFLNRDSMLFAYRWFIGWMYLIGIWMFWFGFSSSLFPEVSVLPALLSIDRR